MAKVSKIEIPVKPIRMYKLELSEDEAQLIFDIIRNVGGSVTTRRRFLHSINSEFVKAGGLKESNAGGLYEATDLSGQGWYIRETE